MTITKKRIGAYINYYSAHKGKQRLLAKKIGQILLIPTDKQGDYELHVGQGNWGFILRLLPRVGFADQAAVQNFVDLFRKA